MSNPLYFPVPNGTISSGMGQRRAPRLPGGGFGSSNHQGVDIRAPAGTPILAPVAGTVVSAQTRGGYGNTIDLRGNDGITYRFAHLQGYNVTPGQMVQGGVQIGRVGSTGNSTGPHLHLETRDAQGRLLNPANVLREARNEGEKLLRSGGDALKSAASGALRSIPVVGGAIADATDAIGLTGDCDIFCQLKRWIEDSGFFQRLAIALLALVFIAAALTMLGKPQALAPVTKYAKRAFS